MVNEFGNTTKRGVVPKFSDLEVITLSLTAEAMSIDSENCLFVRLQSYKTEFPNLISRRQYNARRKKTSKLCNIIRERIANEIDGNETYFCIDSKPIEICRKSRASRCKFEKRTTTLLLLLDIVRLKIHTIMDISYMQFVVLVVLCIPMILQKLMFMTSII